MKKKFLKKSGQDSDFGWIAPGGEHLAKPDAWKQFLGHARGMAANSEQAETLARAFHAGAIKKHNIEHFSRTGKTWVAPGGEHLLTPKARQMFLQKNDGDAEKAKRDHWRTIQDHNNLYVKDEQPKGMSGTISGLKTGTLTQDPAGAASHWRHMTQTPPPPWTVKPGESSADAQQRHIKNVENDLTTSLDELSEPAKPLVSSKKWKEHGLHNSFGKAVDVSNPFPFPYAIYPHEATLKKSNVDVPALVHKVIRAGHEHVASVMRAAVAGKDDAPAIRQRKAAHDAAHAELEAAMKTTSHPLLDMIQKDRDLNAELDRKKKEFNDNWPNTKAGMPLKNARNANREAFANALGLSTIPKHMAPYFPLNRPWHHEVMEACHPGVQSLTLKRASEGYLGR